MVTKPATLRRLRAAIFAACCAFAAGCNSGPVQTFERAANAMEACAELLESVKDEQSALAAVPRIEPVLTEVGDAMTAFMNMAEERPDVRGSEAKLKKIVERMASLTARMKAVQPMIESRTDLPAEFWNEYRLHAARMATSMIGNVSALGSAPANVTDSMKQMLALFEQHGPERVVEFGFIGQPAIAAERLAARLREGAPAGMTVRTFQTSPDKALVIAAPVDDYDALVAKLDPSEIQFNNKARRHVRMAISTKPPEGSLAASNAATAERAAAFEQQMDALRQRASGGTPPGGGLGGGSLSTPAAAPAGSLGASASPQPLPVQVNVPQLIAQLAASPAAARGPLIAQLGEHPTPEGAAAVAALLTDNVSREAAMAALRRMGPIAEGPIIALLPTEDDAANLAGVTLLGEFGSQRSVDLLTLAAEGQNPNVVAAAERGLARIKSGAPPVTAPAPTNGLAQTAGGLGQTAGGLGQTAAAPTAPAASAPPNSLASAVRRDAGATPALTPTAAQAPLGGATPPAAAAAPLATAAAAPADPALGEMRTWTDKSGKYKVDAQFIEIKEGNVRLKLTNGKTVSLSLAKVSETDRAYLKDVQRQRRGELAPADGAFANSGLGGGISQLPAGLTPRVAAGARGRAGRRMGGLGNDVEYRIGDQVDVEDWGNVMTGKVIGLDPEWHNVYVKLSGSERSIEARASSVQPHDPRVPVPTAPPAAGETNATADSGAGPVGGFGAARARAGFGEGPSFKEGDLVEVKEHASWQPGTVVGLDPEEGHTFVTLKLTPRTVTARGFNDLRAYDPATAPPGEDNPKLVAVNLASIRPVNTSGGARGAYQPVAAPPAAYGWSPAPVQLPAKKGFFEKVVGMSFAGPGGRAVIARQGGAEMDDDTSTLEICDLASGNVTSLRGPRNLRLAAISPSGQQLITVSEAATFHDGPLQLWNIGATGLELIKSWHAITDDGQFRWLGWADEGHVMAIDDNGLVSWSIAEPKGVYAILGNAMQEPVFVAGGKQMLLASGPAAAIHDVATGAVVHRIALDEVMHNRRVALSPSGRLLAVADGSSVKIHDAASGQKLTTAFAGSDSGRSLGLCWLNEECVLVGGSDLVHVPSQMTVWTYEHNSQAVVPLGGRVWYVMGGGVSDTLALVPFELPHAGATPVTDSELVLRPGDAVAIEMQVSIPLKQLENRPSTPEAELTRAIEAAGFVLSPNSNKKFVGRGRAGEPTEFRYRMFGQPLTEVQTTTYTPNILELELIVDGQSVWKRGGNFNRTFGISLNEGESVDQALARVNEAPVWFFGSELPPRMLPSSMAEARRSKLTVSGVQ